MNSNKIIKGIKSHLGLESDGDFADFLGIKKNVLSNWKARDYVDVHLLYTKCDFLDANWLLSGGKGEMLRNKTSPVEAEDVKKSDGKIDFSSYATSLKNILTEQKLTSLRLHDIEGLLTLLSQSVGKIQAQLGADNTGNSPDATQEQHRTPRKKRQSM